MFYICKDSVIIHLHMDDKTRVITRENVQYLTVSLTVEKHDRRKKHLLAGWRVGPNTPVTDLMDFVMTDVQCTEILWERRVKFVKSVAMASAESICMIDSVAWNCQTPEFYKPPVFLVSNITSWWFAIRLKVFYGGVISIVHRLLDASSHELRSSVRNCQTLQHRPGRHHTSRSWNASFSVSGCCWKFIEIVSKLLCPLASTTLKLVIKQANWLQSF